MSADRVVYLDSSALVKLVVAEPESDALAKYLERRPARVSCALARVEVIRAVRPHGAPARRRARDLLDRVSLLELDEVLLDAAAELGDPALRSLDAIHLAAAATFAAGLQELVTYDRRMAAAAERLGFVVAAPT
jgi:predicted nucleic acid-binding protein